MNSLVYHIVSGQSFFTGIAFVVFAVLASRSERRVVNRFTVLLFLVGAIFIAISSTPIPYWYYAVAITFTIAWMASKFVPRWRRWSSVAVISVWTIAAAIELPNLTMPTLKSAHARNVMIIGDSLTAGIGSSNAQERWPHLLAQRGFVVQDISHAGDTTANAIERFKSQRDDSLGDHLIDDESMDHESVIISLDHESVIIVEIGGNDILGGTTPKQFAVDLRVLLSEVCGTGTQVAMFELPLPPFSHAYGRIQRSLANKYDVTLIPKRYLLSILAADQSTLDSIHLSKSGHQQMARPVGEFLERSSPE